MRILCSGILCTMAFVSSVPAGGNPDYDPRWTVGDTWKVRYTLRFSNPRAGPPEPDAHEDFVYVYQVVSVEVENGRRTARVRADCDSLHAHWLLVFDADRMVVMRNETIVKGQAKATDHNPFADDAFMANARQYALSVIHDFPRIPPTNTDETRSIKYANGSPFTQSIVFSRDELQADLYRIDPARSVEHRTTIVWKAGQKWWSSAVTTLGGEVQVSGVLESVLPAKENESRKVQDISSNGR